jgi:hypothetical protein
MFTRGERGRSRDFLFIHFLPPSFFPLPSSSLLPSSSFFLPFSLLPHSFLSWFLPASLLPSFLPSSILLPTPILPPSSLLPSSLHPSYLLPPSFLSPSSLLPSSLLPSYLLPPSFLSPSSPFLPTSSLLSPSFLPSSFLSLPSILPPFFLPPSFLLPPSLPYYYVQKRGDCLPIELGPLQQVDLVAAQHLLSSFSSPCFEVKFLYDYGVWLNTGKILFRMPSY